jgi:peptidoglycan hydrolase-like protein with peptidoglycan-binding domain
MRSLIIAGVSAIALSMGGMAVAAAPHQGAAKGSLVIAAQQKLQSEGLYKGKVDGVAGPETRAALKQFQKKNHLQQTGQLDRKTEEKLGLAMGEGSSMPPGATDNMRQGAHQSPAQPPSPNNTTGTAPSQGGAK